MQDQINILLRMFFKINQKKETIKTFIANSSPYGHYNMVANCKAPHICCYLCQHGTSDASVNAFSDYQIAFSTNV